MRYLYWTTKFAGILSSWQTPGTGPKNKWREGSRLKDKKVGWWLGIGAELMISGDYPKERKKIFHYLPNQWGYFWKKWRYRSKLVAPPRKKTLMQLAVAWNSHRKMPWCALQPDVAPAHGVAVGRLETRLLDCPNFAEERIYQGSKVIKDIPSSG